MKTRVFLFFYALIYALISLATPPVVWGAEDPFRVCYFSLNNEKEFTSLQSFVKQLNANSNHKIEVVELMDEVGGDAGAVFRSQVEKMAARGEVCHGLVISGHHTASFGGKRASKTLGIDQMEEMACDPNLRSWFEHINALWLEGCRTLGVGKDAALLPTDEEGDAVPNELSADYHTYRVGRLLEEDGLPQDMQTLNIEFSATLDQDNPLSSRYLRVFPRATVFGWTSSAPGVEKGSENSILFHIAHISKITADHNPIFEDPRGQLSAKAAAHYAEILTSVLNDWGNAPKGCQDASIQGWIDHGHVTKTSQLGYYNPDLNALPSLFSSEDEMLKRAKDWQCALSRTQDPASVLRALDQILNDDVAIGYSYNVIYELFQRLRKEGNIELMDRVDRMLKNSSKLQAFLARKIASPSLGLLRKMDYYRFYRDVTGTRLESLEKQFISLAKDQFARPDEKDDTKAQRDLDDYKETLILALQKHDLTGTSFYEDLLSKVNAPTPTFDVFLSQVVKDPSVPPADKTELIRKAASATNLEDRQIASLVKWSDRVGLGGEIIAKLADRPKLADRSIVNIATVLAAEDPKTLSPEQKAADLALIRKLTARPKSPVSSGEKFLSAAVARTDDPAAMQEVLEDFFASARTDQKRYQVLEPALVRQLKNNWATLPDPAGLAQAILKVTRSPKTQADLQARLSRD